MSCAAPEQGGSSGAAELSGKTVVEGRVLSADAPVAGAFVRLLDGSGEFTAEVVSGPGGQFRFFAAPGAWTIRALAPGASGTFSVEALPGLTSVDVAVAP
jgi:hypothetical protein